jgi:CRISPR/Cas system CSM-associated protein Csm3 (group 7 of RAMP superfamily)
MRENLDDELTEVKSENAIDRITSQANPRTLERVPAGARFRVRLVMDVLCEEDAPLFRACWKACACWKTTAWAAAVRAAAGACVWPT